jgi:hypothetical protein
MPIIQILAIVVSLMFLLYISRQIVKGKLREEYSFVWIFSTVVLLIFSFWRDGLEIVAHALGVFQAPNLVFTAAIFIILVYLLHLSKVASRLHQQNKTLSQELALLKEKVERNLKGKDLIE